MHLPFLYVPLTNDHLYSLLKFDFRCYIIKHCNQIHAPWSYQTSCLIKWFQERNYSIYLSRPNTCYHIYHQDHLLLAKFSFIICILQYYFISKLDWAIPSRSSTSASWAQRVMLLYVEFVVAPLPQPCHAPSMTKHYSPQHI